MTKKLGLLFVLLWITLSLPFSADAITIGPAKLELEANPGDILTGEMSLLNETDKAGTFYISFEKFIEKDGQRVFLPDEESLIDEWAEMPESVFLAAGERQKVPFILRVPENAPPGGHFAVAWWSTMPPDMETGVGIAVRAGILIFLRVSGEVREETEILYSPKQSIVGSLPLSFNVTFKNLGNVHLKPLGNIIIRDLFGRTKAQISINPQRFNVLPESQRTFTSEWKEEGIFFGPYRATLELSYGLEEPWEFKKTALVWVLPWTLVLLIVLALVVVILVIIKGIPKYNRWVIEKAKQKLKEEQNRRTK
ncbi:MAG TPA: hypothetical protein VMV66_01610 [Candidatus Humimicrobiaceae bacterium]|nr:hypothetical protein [Candidatus Humimicrobiaceae bacterium]